jgi:hypothetical protein
LRILYIPHFFFFSRWEEREHEFGENKKLFSGTRSPEFDREFQGVKTRSEIEKREIKERSIMNSEGYSKSMNFYFVLLSVCN